MTVRTNRGSAERRSTSSSHVVDYLSASKQQALAASIVPFPERRTRSVSHGRQSTTISNTTRSAESKGRRPIRVDNRADAKAPELSPIRQAHRDAQTAGADLSSTQSWVCTYCAEDNAEDAVVCRHCGRLSVVKKADILAAKDVFLIDGVRALEAGDEELAHRWFVFATEAHPRCEIAWYWRSRTSTTTQELIACLEQMLSLNPNNPLGQSALRLAKARWQQEERKQLSSPSAKNTDAASESRGREKVDAVRKIGEMPRRILIELASIPCFLLGLLWIGQTVVNSLQPSLSANIE